MNESLPYCYREKRNSRVDVQVNIKFEASYPTVIKRLKNNVHLLINERSDLSVIISTI